MRIKETIEKPGYFWLPEKPDDKIFGTLSIADGGRIELKLEGGLLSEKDNWKTMLEFKGLKRIVGEIGARSVTLDYCYVRSYMSDSSIVKSSVDVKRAFIGVAYEEDEVPRFNSMVLSIEGMTEWVGEESIEVDYLTDDAANLGRTASISYRRPEALSFGLADGMQLLIIFGEEIKRWRTPLMRGKIIPKTAFKLRSQKALELDEFLTVVRKITIFLCFAIDQTICLDRMSAISDDLQRKVGDKKYPIEIKIYYPSWPYSDRDKPKHYLHDIPFRFTDIRDDFEKIINKWLEAYKTFETAFNLYFDAKTGAHKTTLEWQFLALVHAIEAAYPENSPDKKDWLPLEEKVETFIEPFKDRIGNAEERKTLIDAIVHTRNYLTHYNQHWKLTAAKDEDLWRLYFTIDRCFQLYFCHLMDFSSEAIDRVLKFLDWKRSQEKFLKMPY